MRSVDKDVVRFLCIYFARPEARWEDSYAHDRSILAALGKEVGIDTKTKLATYDMDELIEGITDCDVIFINGGFRGRLKDTLLAIGLHNFRQMISGKTLAGISAGANILSRYYYSQGVDDIREGIGLLKIKLLTHYEKDMAGQMKKLLDYKEDLPIVTIAEEEYIVMDQRGNEASSKA